MALGILEAIRPLEKLRGSEFLAALELAHLADDDTGIAETGYEKLAAKMHMSKRTAQRKVKSLVQRGIIAILDNPIVVRLDAQGRTVMRQMKNRYKFLIPWKRGPAHPSKGDRPGSLLRRLGDSLAKALPTPTPFRKDLTLGEEIAKLERGLNLWTPGSEQWQATAEKLAHLRTLRDTLAQARAAVGGGTAAPAGQEGPA
jgi:DNA-binding MarR family transcriptional regulator